MSRCIRHSRLRAYSHVSAIPRSEEGNTHKAAFLLPTNDLEYVPGCLGNSLQVALSDMGVEDGSFRFPPVSLIHRTHDARIGKFSTEYSPYLGTYIASSVKLPLLANLYCPRPSFELPIS